ncbi:MULTISPECIES: GH12 family glycosyl hydrolase domain-containing protein [unclassified Streptomyces]|uniref:GH12 family glycosyl hydrolase domain-containing protein n=1 Tax=unclassified Streptomyces TaxID=2593676 RepID=UPI00093F30ED|nr:cellulose binding domain-containing protein [Streptomyces sp. CB02058]OKI92409.1 glycosyl hydrolase family 5 [Streptomyces sp. CB02058]
MKSPVRLLRSIRTKAAALFVAVASCAALATAAAPAHADTLICEQYGTTVIQGQYVVQNNRWGTSAEQCVNVTATGFDVTRADGSVPTNGAPKSYPSVFNGCHYTNCSPGTKLPAQLSTISSAPTSVSYRYVDNAVYDAAYDIWLDPTPRKDGVNRTEIMIWFNRVGPVQPVGSQTGTATVAGRGWEVWTGNNGGNDVISFVAPSAIASWSFDVMDFVDATVARGMAQNSWYLTSVQAGFEPWQGGAGLGLGSFSSTVELGGGTGGPGEPEEPGEPAEPAACRVSYTANSWTGGFTAEVKVTNTGSTAVDGWELGFTLPTGQTVTQAWNATLTPSSGTVRAVNAAFNGRIEPGGSQSFGFQGAYSGTYAKATRFTLNGTVCTAV